MTDELKAALMAAVEYMSARGQALPPDLLESLHAVGVKSLKTYWGQLLAQFTGLFYFHLNQSTVTTEQGFVDNVSGLIAEYMREAWVKGMKENGWKPADMTEEWEAEIDAIATEEINHIPDLMAFIEDNATRVRQLYNEDFERGKQAEAAMKDILSMRADMWAARWDDTWSRAVLATADPGEKLMWVYGDTEHCETCRALNGIVAPAEDWEASSYRPQSPPNESLECGGWRCQCYLEPTDKRRNLPRGISIDDFVERRK